jgi:hypothetical protein
VPERRATAGRSVTRAATRPYWITTFAFAETLVVSSVPSECPRLGALRQTLAATGTLCSLEREIFGHLGGEVAVGQAAVQERGERLGVLDRGLDAALARRISWRTAIV